jgi:hypothetical protein
MTDFARLLIIIGLVISSVGLLILIVIHFFPWLGNLPGDIRFEAGNSKVYIPLATMLLVSIVATVLLNIVIRIFRR